MVLYCIDIPVLMSNMLVYRFKMHADKKVVALVDRKTYESRNLINVLNNFVEKKIFCDVIFGDVFFDANRNISVEEYESYVIEYYNDMLKKSGYEISQFEEIVVSNDWWDGRINVYLNIIKKEYTWLNINANDLLEKIYFKCSVSCFNLFMKYNALSPFAPFCHPVMLENCKKINLLERKIEYKTYLPEREIKNLTNKVIQMVIDCYGYIEVSGNVTIFIPNSYGFLFDDIALKPIIKEDISWSDYGKDEWLFHCFRIACDYYVGKVNNVYVKAHPNDPIDDNQLKNIMNQQTYNFTSAPWEWIESLWERKKSKVNTIIGIASTAIENMSDNICNNLIILGESYKKTWYFYDALFIVFSWISNKKNYIEADETIQSQLALLSKVYANNTVLKKDAEIICRLVDAFKLADEKKSVLDYIENPEETVCFFNINKLPLGIEMVNQKYLTCIEYEYIGQANHIIDYSVVKPIWIYSKNEKIHIELRNFKLEKELPNRNMKLLAHAMSREKISLQMNDYSLKSKIAQLEKNVYLSQRRIGNIILNQNTEYRAKIQRLRSINNINDYLDLLSYLLSHCTVVLAVKDTPGSNLDEVTIEQLEKIGFKSFKKDLWRTYIGVSSQLLSIDHLSEKAEEPLYEKFKICESDFYVVSKPWRNGNDVKIVINEIDYAVGIRGINIVVTENESGQVVDSIAYDAHGKTTFFERKIHKTDRI